MVVENERRTRWQQTRNLMMVEAARRFLVRIRIGARPQGLGGRLDEKRAWLDGNCGTDGWALTPSGMRGVLNDSVRPVVASFAQPFLRVSGMISCPTASCQGDRCPSFSGLPAADHCMLGSM